MVEKAITYKHIWKKTIEHLTNYQCIRQNFIKRRLIRNQKIVFKITLTLADISHCVVFALISQTNLVNQLEIFTTWEYGKSQTISSWR